MVTASLQKARAQYNSAHLDLAMARAQRNNFVSNYERDIRAMDVKHGEERVGIALDALWKAQCRYKVTDDGDHGRDGAM